MMLQLDGENLEQVEHLPSQKHDRNDDHHDGDGFSEIQPVAVGLKAPRDQPKNVERGEAENQGPEDVIDVAFFAEILKQNQDQKLEPDRGLQPL